MDKQEVIEIVIRFAEAVSREIKIKNVYLYGSYARGSAGNDSDIDVAVVVDHLDGDFLDTEVMLYRTRRSVDERIEPVLVNEQKDNSGFLDDIKNHGLVVYGN